jgi:hypothetical protein
MPPTRCSPVVRITHPPAQRSGQVMVKADRTCRTRSAKTDAALCPDCRPFDHRGRFGRGRCRSARYYRSGNTGGSRCADQMPQLACNHFLFATSAYHPGSRSAIRSPSHSAVTPKNLGSMSRGSTSKASIARSSAKLKEIATEWTRSTLPRVTRQTRAALIIGSVPSGSTSG